MLMNLHKKNWVDGLTLRDYEQHCNLNRETVAEMLKLAKDYDKSLEEEEKMTAEQLEIKNVGKVDPKRHLEEKVDVLMTNNVVQCLGAMLDTIVFKWILFVLHVLLLTPTFWPTEYLTPCPLKNTTIVNEVTLAPPLEILWWCMFVLAIVKTAQKYTAETRALPISLKHWCLQSWHGKLWDLNNFSSLLLPFNSAWRLAYLIFCMVKLPIPLYFENDCF